MRVDPPPYRMAACAGVSVTTSAPQRLSIDDLDGVYALLRASDLAVLGMTDFTTDDISADLLREGLQAYGWYVAGQLAAYSWVSPGSDSNQVELDLYVHPEQDAALGHDVLAHLCARASELARAAGYRERWLDIGIYRQDERSQSWLRRWLRGWHHVHQDAYRSHRRHRRHRRAGSPHHDPAGRLR